jgi:hypothetical protein
MTTFKNIGGYFGGCGYDVIREFALDILPHMRKDVLSQVPVVRWSDGLPVVLSTFKNLGGLNDWAGDNYGYCFDVLWNGDTSERGNIVGELGCLLPTVAVVVLGIIGLLSGSTVVLDLYNWIVRLFS